MSSDADHITAALNRLATSTGSRWDRIAPLVDSELRKISEKLVHQFAVTGRPATVEPAELVNEFYLRLLKEDQRRWVDRRHFFAYASAAMRSILLDRHRSRRAAKRPSPEMRVPLEETRSKQAQEAESRIAITDAIAELARLSERQAKIVEMRFYAGLELSEIAELLQISEKTVQRDWLAARAFLYSRLGDGGPFA